MTDADHHADDDDDDDVDTRRGRFVACHTHQAASKDLYSKFEKNRPKFTRGKDQVTFIAIICIACKYEGFARSYKGMAMVLSRSCAGSRSLLLDRVGIRDWCRCQATAQELHAHPEGARPAAHRRRRGQGLDSAHLRPAAPLVQEHAIRRGRVGASVPLPHRQAPQHGRCREHQARV